MRYRLEGPWRKGLAFDLHTVSSVYLGPDEYGHEQFENTRSDIGEMVYQLKYKQDRSVVPAIVDLLSKLRGYEKFDFLIPVPPSTKDRALDPVREVTEALGRKFDVPVLSDLILNNGIGPPLKSIDEIEKRREALKARLSLTNPKRIEGKSLLVIDDLYRSGETLSACTELLISRGEASDVCVLAMTKTRTKR